MENDERTEYLTRSSVLELLSDDEVARVSNAETAARLAHGEEYVDLERLDQGVRRAVGPTAPMGRVLPRKAVPANTWNKIVAHLLVPSTANGQPRA